LFPNVANEVLHGFRVREFERTIGASPKQVETIADDLLTARKNALVVIDRHQVLVFRNALAVVLEELGVEEFQTRTGYDFDLGRGLLNQMNQFLDEDTRGANANHAH